ncbi:MAG: RHS repeat protein, partial [Sphingobacteriales bacterium]
MKLIFKHFALILSALLLVAQVMAQDFQFLPDGDTKTYYSKNIKTNGGSNTVYNEDLGTAATGEWLYMKTNSSTWQNKYLFKSVVNTLGVKIDHASRVIQANYKYKIVLQVTGYANPSNPSSGTTLPPYEFELEYNKDSLAAYKDLNILRLPGSGFYSFQVRLLDVFDISGSSPVTVNRAALAENFMIETKVITQRYDFDDLTMKDVFINSQYNSTTQSLEVHWANMPMNDHKFAPPGYLPANDAFKPVKYELEWLYIDDYVLNANGTKSYKFSSSSYTIPYDFRNNSTRVQTHKNSYSIPMVYGHGAVIFRLRKVRPSSVNFSETVYYPWNLAESGTLTPNQFYVNGNGSAAGCPKIAPSNCLFINETPFISDSLNWQYNVSFAEEGKYKHVVNYFDGMGKNRQTQTKINSDDQYVIGVDNIYDYEGRPAITSLPTPVQSQDVKYKSNLTLNAATGLPYNAADFDSGCGTDSIAPLSPQALSNIYYSGLNPDKAGMQKFVPDAEGYPIIETRYAADYTDKVQWQGGAGLEFQRWKGKGTKYVYSRAGQRELNRLFGSEGGYAQYYPKQTLIDPNGQASFSITDASGKVVATGLSGTSPDSSRFPIQALNTLPSATYHEYDVLKNLPQDTGRTFRNAQSSYFNEALSENSLQYKLKIPPFQNCFGQYIHVAADYNVKLIEECQSDTTAPAIIEFTGTAGANTVNTSSDPLFGTSSVATAQLVPDKYTIIKEIKFSDSAINRQSVDFVKDNSGVGLCYKGSEPFVRTEIESSTFPCPPESASSSCAALKRQMMQELYPGAKYGQYLKGPDGKFAAGMSNSIFTKNEPPSSFVWQDRAPNDTPQLGDRCQYNLQTSYGTRKKPANWVFNPYTLQDMSTWPCEISWDDEIITQTYPFALDPHINDGIDCGMKYYITSGPSQCKYLAPATATLECRYEIEYFGTVSGIAHSCPHGWLAGGGAAETYTFWRNQPASINDIPATTPMTVEWKCGKCGQSGLANTTGSRAAYELPEPIACRYLVPHYRYQSACLGAGATINIKKVSITGTKYTQAVPLINVTPDMLIASFDDAIAEALLPLHPEYCKLQACDDSDFDNKLKNLETYEQAQALGLHTLNGILSNDPISEYYSGVPGAVPAEKLSFFEMDANLSGAQVNVLRRFDTMALIRAYCGSNSTQASLHCEQTVHAADIAAMNLPNTEIKDRFFRALRDLYLSNRSLRLQQSMDGLANSCGPCAGMPDERMTLTGDPVFPVVFGGTGSFDLDLNDTDLENLINSRINNTTDNTVPAYVSNLVNGSTSASAAVTDYCKGQIDVIIKDLTHCGMSTTALNNIRDGLNSYCATNADLPKITPEVVRSLILTHHGNLSDLCQPFITQYRLFEPSAENLGDYVSGPQALYAGLNLFLNRSAVVSAVKSATATAGTFTGINLDPANAFDVALATKLGVVTNATVNLSAMTNNVTVGGGTIPVIRVTVSAGANTEYLYLSSRAGDAGLLPNPGGAIAFTEPMSVMADYPAATVVEGGIADKLAFIKVVSGTQVSRYSVWSSTIPFLKLKNKNGIEDCINCELLRRGMAAYKTNATYFNLPLNAGHPLFGNSLKNYLNYNLKANQSVSAYAGLMEGCAISDKIDFKNAPATIELSLATGSGEDVFGNAKIRMQNIRAQFPDISIPYYAFRRTNGEVKVRINLSSVDTAKLRYVIPAIMNTGNAVYLPGGYDAELFGNGFGTVSIPNATTSAEAVDFMSEDHTLSSLGWLQVNGTAGTDPLTKANLMDAVGSYIRTNPDLALYRLHLGYKLYRSEDYTNSNKRNYLDSVYAQGSLDALALADKLADMPFLNTAMPGLSGFDKSYNNPWHENTQSDLLYWNQAQTHTGKTRVQNTINQVKAVLGSNKLFPATSQVTISGTAGLGNNSVKAFRMGNGYAWYRVFDNNDRAYNIYLVPPAQMIAEPEQYQLSSTNPNIKLLGGDSAIYRFSVTMVKGSHTVEVQGFADFPIGTGGRLQNVVIQKDAYRKGALIDTMSCEQGIRSFAKGQGLQAYRGYIDSIERWLQFAIRDHLLKNTVDTLIHGTKEQQYHYTLYYYDQMGNLTKTVPPQGVNPVLEPAFAAVEQARNATSLAQKANHNKISRYRYNSYNQPVWQQTPDGGITEFFYDKAGRLAFSQNAKQLQGGTFSYTLYDQQGRIEESGVLSATRPNIEDVLNQTVSGGISPYANWVKGKTRTEVVATRYDDPVISLGGYDMLNEQRNLRKRVSAVLYSPSVTTQQSIDEYYHFATHFSYDAMGNVDMLVQDNPYLNYMQQRFKRVDYDYDLLSGKVNMLSFNRGHADQFYQKYAYDADNRITKAETSKDGLKWDRDAAYAYYKHGPLAEMQLGDLNVQGVQYAYTIQGWLKAINGDVLNPGDDMGKNGNAAGSVYPADVMAHSLDYFKNDYKAIDATALVTHTPALGKSLYNGNIARQTTAIAGMDNLVRDYSYDQLHRIKSASYSAYENVSYAVSSLANAYKNTYSYDADGNLQTLKRFNGQATEIDNFTYHYTNATQNNKLSYVQDAAVATGAGDLQPGQANANYTYDEIGNLLTDRQEGIKAIEWNSYGKMSRLTKGTATDDTLTMIFHYDGMGNRIRKDVWREVPGSAGGLQDRVSDIYARDAQGNILAVYKEHAKVNGGATIDWLNSQLYQVASTSEVASFLSSQFGSNGTFTYNLYGYSLVHAPDWSAAQLSERDIRFYMSQSGYMFGHALETQLAESWPQLRDLDPSEFLPLLKDSDADLNLT